ncbi:unnamed protein product [Blepharisma stoltei]|uniref:Adenosine deaminase domain-containing protein n=1 Tax=Blepharisma stoltei TaxID=1481888 RepID=A0AAU9K9F6_9CILI|nr:unnamed protein product [Blepharisma stoltei]
MGEFFQQRQELIAQDIKDLALMKPTELEILANLKLSQIKEQFSTQYSIDDMLDFWSIRDSVINTRLFQIFKKMPKGAVLHMHYGGMLPAVDVLSILKNDPEIYIKTIDNCPYIFSSCQTDSISLTQYLENPENEKTLLNVLETNREKSVGLPSECWSSFMQIFTSTLSAFSDNRILEKYIELAFTRFYEDNVQRVEFRHMPFSIQATETDGLPSENIAFLKNVCERFTSNHPDFTSGAILCTIKLFSKERIIKETEEIYMLHLLFPKFVLGFDIPGEEEKYREDEDIFGDIHRISENAKKSGNHCPIFLHAGEVVNKPGPTVYDAFAIGSKRIGHGISLIKHPQLLRIAKKEKITIESCPISNMILGYVRDPRVHPALAYLFQGIPVTISSDDPGCFGYSGVTHDWVWIYMLWGINLMHVKKMIENSIDGCTEPEEVRRVWEGKWQEFIEYLANLEI